MSLNELIADRPKPWLPIRVWSCICDNAFRLINGANANYVLTSDAQGFGTWQPVAPGGIDEVVATNASIAVTTPSDGVASVAATGTFGAANISTTGTLSAGAATTTSLTTPTVTISGGSPTAGEVWTAQNGAGLGAWAPTGGLGNYVFASAIGNQSISSTFTLVTIDSVQASDTWTFSNNTTLTCHTTGVYQIQWIANVQCTSVGNGVYCSILINNALAYNKSSNFVTDTNQSTGQITHAVVTTVIQSITASQFVQFGTASFDGAGTYQMYCGNGVPTGSALPGGSGVSGSFMITRLA